MSAGDARTDGGGSDTGYARIFFTSTAEIRVRSDDPSPALLNGGYDPDLPATSIRPSTFRESLVWEDGSTGAGVAEPCMLWLVEAAGMRILVDTGMTEDHARHANAVARQRRQPLYFVAGPEDGIDRFLAACGTGPEEIDLVVLSHLHYDHFANIGAYPKARVLVHERELALALAPPPYAHFHWPEFNGPIVCARDRMATIQDRVQICDEVEVWTVGGHSPGLLAMAVQTQAGRVVLASDFFTTYANLDHAWPPGICPYLDEWEDNCRAMLEAGDLIVPGHDYEVMDRFPSGRIGDPDAEDL